MHRASSPAPALVVVVALVASSSAASEPAVLDSPAPGAGVETGADVLRSVDVARDAFVPSRLLLKGATSPTGHIDLDALGARHGVRLRELRPLHFGWRLIEARHPGPHAGADRPLDDAETASLARELVADPAVETVAFDEVMRPLLSPLDPLRPSLWPLDAIRAEAAWDLATAGEAVIGVVDTGLRRSHLDLNPKDLAGYDFISDVTVAVDGDGRDADWTDPGTVTECNGEAQTLLHHGTHISAVVAASADDGVGVPGIDWQAQIVSARTMNVCGGVASDLLDALAWLAGYSVEGAPAHGAALRVVNLSLGARVACSSALQEYVTTLATTRGMVFVAAAGNDGSGVEVFAPASCQGVVSVGASTLAGERAPYTADIGRLDVLAPGGDIALADRDGVLSACGEGDECYSFAQGTSVAAAYVSGAVSLLLGQAPDLDAAGLIAIFQDTGEPCVGCAVPRLRLDLALAAAVERGGEPFVPPASHCVIDPCGPGGRCGEGERCVSLGGGEPCCLLRCATDQPSCRDDELCAPVGNDGSGVCTAGGLGREGDTCGEDEPCAPGFLCQAGEGICVRRCGEGQICRDIDQTCQETSTSSVCFPPLSSAEAGSGPEDCDLRRGNWDCPETWACLPEDEGATCVRGAAGELLDVALCTEPAECASGLCLEGVCAVPCDDDGTCYVGATCDEAAAPGGICLPDPCTSNEGCAEGLTCVTTAAGASVCARTSCGCRASGGDSPVTLVAIGAAGMLGALRRRRTTAKDRMQGDAARFARVRG